MVVQERGGGDVEMCSCGWVEGGVEDVESPGRWGDGWGVDCRARVI